MAENRALGGGRHKLVLVLLAGVFAQVAEAPRVKLVKRGLWGHGREVLGIDGAGLSGRGDGDDGVVGEVVAAGEGDALGGGDEAGEHCYLAKKRRESFVSPVALTHENFDQWMMMMMMTYLILEDVFFGFP